MLTTDTAGPSPDQLDICIEQSQSQPTSDHDQTQQNKLQAPGY